MLRAIFLAVGGKSIGRLDYATASDKTTNHKARYIYAASERKGRDLLPIRHRHSTLRSFVYIWKVSNVYDVICSSVIQILIILNEVYSEVTMMSDSGDL